MSTPNPNSAGKSKAIKLSIAVVLLLAAVVVGYMQLSGSDGQNAAPIDSGNPETPPPTAAKPNTPKPVAETPAEKSMQTEGSLGGSRRVAPK